MEYEDSGLSVATSVVSKRTFSSAPHVPKAAPRARDNHTFIQSQLDDMARENKALVGRITDIATKPGQFGKMAMEATKKKPRESSQEVNRRREAERIAKENLRMFQRLQGAKADKSVDRRKLAADAKRNSEYAENIRQVKNTTSSSRPGWQD